MESYEIICPSLAGMLEWVWAVGRKNIYILNIYLIFLKNSIDFLQDVYTIEDIYYMHIPNKMFSLSLSHSLCESL